MPEKEDPVEVGERVEREVAHLQDLVVADSVARPREHRLVTVRLEPLFGRPWISCGQAAHSGGARDFGLVRGDREAGVINAERGFEMTA
jgi:hypothetical protein